MNEKVMKPKKSIREFLKGMGSVMDLSGTYFEPPRSIIIIQKESKAIESDWEKIGQDMNESIYKYRKDHKRMLVNQ